MAIPLKRDPNNEWEAAYARTPPGMAHLAVSGPAGKTCRECRRWGEVKRYASGSGDHAMGELKPAKCSKYRELMRDWGKPVRHSAPACKHFEQSDNPPAIIQIR